MAVVIAASSASAADRYDPRLRFRTLRTGHFDVHFHQGEQPMAERLAAIAERVRERFQPIFGVARGRVHVVLVDQTDLSNGFATPFPYDTIGITAVPPASETLIGNTTDWLELAFTHEYTHILHLDRSRSFMNGVRAIFGRAPLVFPNEFLPIWQIEGLATFEESRMTGEGRIPAGDFRAIVDVAAGRRRFEPIDRASGGLDDWPAGGAAYAYGAYFHQYLADRYGPERLSRLADATAGRVPLFGDGAFTNVFGRSSRQLWADFRAAREQAAPARSVTDSHATRLTHHGYDVGALRASADGVLRYAIDNADGFPALMELGAGGAPRRLAWRVGGSRTSVQGDWIVFDQLERARSIALFTDLYALNTHGGRAIRLTHEARAEDPDLSPDSRRIVCTVQAIGRRALALLDFDATGPKAAVPRVIVDDPAADFTGPRWSPDGRSIVAGRRTASAYELVIVDPETKAVRTLLAAAARLITPSWTHDGSTVLFAADPGDAPFNIFAVDIAAGRVSQVTDTAGGAQFPDLSASGTLAYVGYTPDGYDIFSVPTRASDWTPVSLDASRPQRGSSGSSGSSGSPGSGSSGSGSTGSYVPLRTLVPTYWWPEVRSDAGETLFGASTAMSDVLGRHAYSADAEWSGARARPDWHVAYSYDRWRPTVFATYSDDTDPVRGGEVRSREAIAGVLLPFRRIRWSETLMAAFDGETDTLTAAPGFVVRDGRRDFRSIRGGWLHDSRRQFRYSISTEEGFAVEAAAETSRTALGSGADGGAAIVDARAFRRVFGRHTVIAARFAFASAWGPAGSRRVFSAAGPGPSIPVFDFGRDTVGLLRGLDPEDVIGTRAAVVNLDLRLPLVRVQRGLGTWPLFLRSIHTAAFADAGNAWEGSFRGADVRTSIGGELSADTVVLHYAPITITSGLAWVRDPIADTRAVAFFGRVGYAF